MERTFNEVVVRAQPFVSLGRGLDGMESVDDLEELFLRESERLVRSLGVAFGAEAAADAVQDAFIEADRRWKTVSKYRDPGAWVRRVAINRLRSGGRSRRRRAEILAAVRPVAASDLNAELIDLRDAVAGLPEQQRLSICLHYLAGLPIAEVAAALDVAEGTVKSNLHDARSNLRFELREEIADG